MGSIRTASLIALVTCSMACGKAERELTSTVLTNAYSVDGAASTLTGGYSSAFAEQYGGGWDGVRKYSLGPEGRTAAAFLEQYRKPTVVPNGPKRATELRELSIVTAELASLALDPRGTWISYAEELNAMQTRFKRALLVVEMGSRETVLAEAKGQAGSRLASLRYRIQTAIQKAAAEEEEHLATQKADAAEEEASRHEDLARQTALQAERRREEIARVAAERQREIDEAFKRRSASGQPEPGQKLGGGNFPTGPK